MVWKQNMTNRYYETWASFTRAPDFKFEEKFMNQNRYKIFQSILILE